MSTFFHVQPTANKRTALTFLNKLTNMNQELKPLKIKTAVKIFSKGTKWMLKQG